MSDDSKKRPASASLSDLDTSGASGQALTSAVTSTPAKDGNLFPVLTEAKQGDDEITSSNAIEKQLVQINGNLSNMLTKNDTGFLNFFIKDTICEFKDELLKPIIPRIEILESDVIDQAKEIETLNKELAKQDTVVENLNEKTKFLEDQIRSDEDYVDNVTNELEQYGRRNNVRISGINGDANRHSSETSTELVINTIKKKTGQDISVHEIDVAHRLGK